MLYLVAATFHRRKTLEKYILLNAETNNLTEPVKKGEEERKEEKNIFLTFSENEIIFS